VQAKSLKGEQLAEQYLESLNRYGIQVDKIRAQASDGASNMSGKHKQLILYLRRQVARFLCFVIQMLLQQFIRLSAVL
jgi:sulfur relay (sulfurtransferase) DsrC/TusE family protein